MLFVAALAVVLLAAPLPGEREEHAIAPEMDLAAGPDAQHAVVITVYRRLVVCRLHAAVMHNHAAYGLLTVDYSL